MCNMLKKWDFGVMIGRHSLAYAVIGALVSYITLIIFLNIFVEGDVVYNSTPWISGDLLHPAAFNFCGKIIKQKPQYNLPTLIWCCYHAISEPNRKVMWILCGPAPLKTLSLILSYRCGSWELDPVASLGFLKPKDQHLAQKIPNCISDEFFHSTLYFLTLYKSKKMQHPLLTLLYGRLT